MCIRVGLYNWQNLIWIILFIVVEYWTFKANKGNLLFNYHISILYYSIGFTDLALKFWRQISKSGVGAFLIRYKIVLQFYKATMFSRIFCLMFLIKPKVENKFKTCFIFLCNYVFVGGGVENKIYIQFCFFSCYVFWWQQIHYSKETRKIIMI